jgi:hypothetical protein
VILYKQYIFLSKIELKIEYAINYPIFLFAGLYLDMPNIDIQIKKIKSKKKPTTCICIQIVSFQPKRPFGFSFEINIRPKQRAV